MKPTLALDPEAPPSGALGSDPAPTARPRRRLGRRLLRLAGIAVVSAIAVVLVSAVANAAITDVERAARPAYGQRVDVGDRSLNVYRHGTTGPTLVLLSGYGTPAPALDFAPLIRELDGYQVVVVEGFGYGYSDMVASPRTVENITTELHTALGKLGLAQPYILMGHSIAGLYTLYYANHYRSEVSAVVGIDASLPGQMNGIAGGGDPLERVAASIGVLRLALAINPTLFDPDGDAYTAAEHEQMRLMQQENFGNAAVVDEGVQSTHNFAVVDGMSYPRDLPVLSFIKKDGNQAGWRDLHQAQLQDLDRGELVELDGGHYLHWTQSKAIAQKVTEFLAGTVTE